MSRYSDKTNRHAVYAAAATWKERCLVSTGSLFTARQLWTPANFDHLYSHFNEQPLAPFAFSQRLRLWVVPFDLARDTLVGGDWEVSMGWYRKPETLQTNPRTDSFAGC